MTILSAQSIQQSAPSLVPDFVLNPNPEIFLSDNYAVIDFETTNLDKGSATNPSNSIVLAVAKVGRHFRGRRGVGRGDGVFIFHGSEYEQSGLLRLLEAVDFVVAHNAKFELQWLRRVGLELRSIVPYCTQIGEYCLAGNRKWALSLDATARRYGLGGKLSFVSSLIKGGVNPIDIPRSKLVEYCVDDVLDTEAVFLKQRVALREKGLLPVAYCRNIFTPVLADIEFEGMQLDSDRVSNELDKVQREFRDAKLLLDGLTGGLNQNSAKQLREYLYDKLGFEPPTDHRGEPIRTPKGEYAVGKDIIGKLEARTDEQREFLRAIKAIVPLKKKLQILEKMHECCLSEEDKGHVYATFNQTVTQTHRLSSTGRKWGFQFHNFPRAYKPLFRSRSPERVLVEGDAPQLEFRVAVDLGNDQRGLQAVCEGVDVHALTSEVMGLERTPAKAYTFKPLYGGSSGTRKERAYYDAFRREYSGVYRTQQGWTYTVLADKCLRIASGLIFYWDDCKLTASGYITNTASIFNYPVQSFATADIVPISVLCLWHRIGGVSGITLVNTVHDSVIAEVQEDMVEYYRQQLIESFTKDVYTVVEKLYGRKLKVPLGVGIKVGRYWGEGKEEKVEAVHKIQEYLQSNLGNESNGAGDRSNALYA